MPYLISQRNISLGGKYHRSKAGRKNHLSILDGTLANFSFKNISVGKFVSSTLTLIITPFSIELIPVGKIHDTRAMLKFHFSNNESFGADFSDFSDIFDAILVFNGGAFGFG